MPANVEEAVELSGLASLDAGESADLTSRCLPFRFGMAIDSDIVAGGLVIAVMEVEEQLAERRITS